MIRESLFFRPQETGFQVFRDLWKIIYLRVIWEPSTFVGIMFHFFGDFSVIKARKLPNWM